MSVFDDEVRTVLSFSCQNLAKQLKVVNDAFVSVLNNEVALELKSDEEHELAKEAYMDTKSAVETLLELSSELDETDHDEPSVSERFNPTVPEDEQ